MNCIVDSVDKFNARLMALSTWLFFASTIMAACLYHWGKKWEEDWMGKTLRRSFYLDDMMPRGHEIWCYALCINALLSLFPTYYCIIICNTFKTKIIANQALNAPLLPIVITFYYNRFDALGLMMFGIGWSVAMFVVTAGKGQPLAYIAAGAFIVFTPLCAITAANAGTMSNYQVFFNTACWFFGFMVWSSMEGYTHVHQFCIAPDARLYAWNGPVKIEIPNSKEVTTAYGYNLTSEDDHT